MAEQKQDSPALTVRYMAFGGRAAPLRAAAFVGGVAYQDEFITNAKEQKAEGKRRWSGLPEIVVGDQVIGQSNACLRYIGALGGLYPKEPLTAALADEVMDSCEDVFGAIGPTFGLKGDEQKAAREALMAEDGKIAYWNGKFEARLAENAARGNEKGFFVGDALTVADLKFYYTLGFLKSGMLDYIEPADVAKGCDRINALLKTIGEDERIKKFEAAFAAQQAQSKESGTLSFFVAANK